jgi:transcriptional regulator with XRE-family HTH domain
MIPLQIKVLRRQRDWSQERLAKESKLTQGVISRAEDPDYGNLTINTLVRVGAGFDCAFIGRFAPFSELGKWYTALDDENALQVPSFDSDNGLIRRKEPQAAAIKGADVEQSAQLQERLADSLCTQYEQAQILRGERLPQDGGFSVSL